MKPNILYINSHDTGRLIEPYGYPVPTPNLRQFAREGVIFRQAFCAGPTCSPSRAALVTGCYPHENGMIGLAHRGFALNDYSKHLVTTLRGAGYSTTLVGFQHVAHDVSKIGYDRVIHSDAGDRDGPVVTKAAIEFLESRPSEPFYLEVGFMETHREFPEPTPAEDPRYCRPPAQFSDTPETRYDFACFKRSAALLDDQMGAVFAALERSGLAGNTLVVCTTDHGAAFPRMKCNMHDGGTGVMLMMRGPGGFTGGQTIDALVSHVDVYPTICEAAGAAKPSWLRGVSLAPLVHGAERVREEVHSEVTYHAAYEPQRSVRTGRWRYVRRYGDRRKVVLPNTDDGPTKTLWMDEGWGSMEHPVEALYDMLFDPLEMNNLAGDRSAAPVLADMRARLDRWMNETNDPMRAGFVQAPKGARVNDSDGVSPTDKPTIIE